MRELFASLPILKQRYKRYVSGNYQDVAESLAVVIAAIERCRNNFTQFAQFIQNNTSNRLLVAALHVALAAALRKIGVDLYRDALNQQSKMRGTEKSLLRQELKDATRLYVDGVSAGIEILVPLARDFLGVNLRLYDFQQKKPIICFNPITTEKENLEVSSVHAGSTVPEICLLKKPGHWDFAYRAEQTTGLAAGNALIEPTTHVAPGYVTSGKDQHSQMMAETIELVVLEQAKARVLNRQPERVPEQLKEVTALVDQLNQSLLSLGTTKQRDQRATLAGQHDEFSSSIVATVREHLKVSTQKINAIVGVSKNKNLAALKKNILLGNMDESAVSAKKNRDVDPQVVADERLARSLQNAEILAFMSENAATLFGRAPVKTARKVNAPRSLQATVKPIKV